MTVQDLLGRLTGVRSRGPSRWSARCPAHADKSPSLSIREDNTRVLIRCFSGCSAQEIVSSLGLRLRNLFTDAPSSRGQRPIPKPKRIDLVGTAFEFEMAALDRRLRADAVLQAVGNFDGDELTDEQRERLMSVVAGASEDRERAQFLEAVADDFRMKAFHERTDRDAA